MDADAAVQRATAHVPDGAVVRYIWGQEGRFWGQTPADDLAPLAAATPDGELGDGLLGAWYVGFEDRYGTYDVLVFADDRVPVMDMEPFAGGRDRRTDGVDPSGRLISSDDAARAAAMLPEIQEHVAAYPLAGITYLYTPYAIEAYQEVWMGDIKERVNGNRWQVLRYDPGVAVGEDPPVLATIDIDAATGKVIESELRVPTRQVAVLELSLSEGPGFVPSMEPVTVTELFHVPRFAERLEGWVTAQAGGGLAGARVHDAWLLGPDGRRQADLLDSWGGPLPVDIERPEEGGWLLQVEWEGTPNSTLHIGAYLRADVATDLVG